MPEPDVFDKIAKKKFTPYWERDKKLVTTVGGVLDGAEKLGDTLEATVDILNGRSLLEPLLTYRENPKLKAESTYKQPFANVKAKNPTEEFLLNKYKNNYPKPVTKEESIKKLQSEVDFNSPDFNPVSAAFYNVIMPIGEGAIRIEQGAKNLPDEPVRGASEILLGTAQTAINLIPQMMGINAASPTLMKGLGEGTEAVGLGKEVGEAIAHYGSAFLFKNPKVILAGMLASQGASEVAKKITEDTDLTEQDKKMIIEGSGHLGFFGGMWGSHAIIKNRNIKKVSEVIKEAERLRNLPPGKIAEEARKVETSQVPVKGTLKEGVTEVKVGKSTRYKNKEGKFIAKDQAIDSNQIAIDRMSKEGKPPEQIAEVLQIPVEEVKQKAPEVTPVTPTDLGGGIKNKVSDPNSNVLPISEIDKIRGQEKRDISAGQSVYNDEIQSGFEKNGVTEPLVITYYPNEGKALLTDGHTRLDVAKDMGVEKMPIRIVEKYSDAPTNAKDFNPESTTPIEKPPIKVEGGESKVTEGAKKPHEMRISEFEETFYEKDSPGDVLRQYAAVMQRAKEQGLKLNEIGEEVLNNFSRKLSIEDIRQYLPPNLEGQYGKKSQIKQSQPKPLQGEIKAGEGVAYNPKQIQTEIKKELGDSPITDLKKEMEGYEDYTDLQTKYAKELEQLEKDYLVKSNYQDSPRNVKVKMVELEMKIDYLDDLNTFSEKIESIPDLKDYDILAEIGSTFNNTKGTPTPFQREYVKMLIEEGQKRNPRRTKQQIGEGGIGTYIEADASPEMINKIKGNAAKYEDLFVEKPKELFQSPEIKPQPSLEKPADIPSAKVEQKPLKLTEWLKETNNLDKANQINELNASKRPENKAKANKLRQSLDKKYDDYLDSFDYDTGKSNLKPQPKRTITDDQYKQDIKTIKDQPATSGFDPKLVTAYVRAGAYHLENVIRSGVEKSKQFTEWSKKMIGELGEKIKPYLLKIWAGIKQEFGEVLLKAYESKLNPTRPMGVILDSKFVTKPSGESLGGMFKDIANKDFETISKEYETVIKQNESKFYKAKESTEKLFEDTKKGIKNTFEILSTSVEKISPETFQKFRRFEQTLGFRNLWSKSVINKYLDGQKKANMTLNEKAQFEAGLDNPKFFHKAREMAQKKGFGKEFEDIIKHMEDLATKLDVKLMANHFPRMVKDYLGLREEIFKRFPEYKATLEKMIADYESKNGKKTYEQQMNYINNALRGYNPKISGVTLSDLGNMKKRMIPVLDGELKKYYHSSNEAIGIYTTQMNELIAAKSFFGKGGFDLEQSIGVLLKDLESTGKIQGKDAGELKDLIKTRFNHRGITNKALRFLRDVGIVTKLANPFAAMTQVKDLSFSIALSPTKTMAALSESVKRRMFKEEMGFGLEEIGFDANNYVHELSNAGNRQRLTSALLKVNGFFTADMIGKEVRINTTLKKFQDWAAKNPTHPEFQRRINRYFGGEEKAKVINDLKLKNKSDSVGFLLYNELSNMQPITLFEHPKNYVVGGNSRIYYFLKTFTVRQLDFVLNETIRVMKDKSLPKEQRIQGYKNFAKLIPTIVILGAGVDEVKKQIMDLITGKESNVNFGDEVINNMLNIVLLSRYDAASFKEEGGEAIAKKIAPPLDFPADELLDTYNLLAGKNKAIRSTKQIPVVGRFLYNYLKNGNSGTVSSRRRNSRSRNSRSN